MSLTTMSIIILCINMKWWLHVIKAPEDSKIIVFNKGTAKASNVWIPIGGQDPPISIVGAKLEWKKAQNTEKKAITSEIINKIIPMFKPACTWLVWSPR